MSWRRQNYENHNTTETLIVVLERYVEEIIEYCNTIKQVIADCVEILAGDVVAERNCLKLQRYVENIESQTERIMELIEGLKAKVGDVDGVPPDWYLKKHPEWYDKRG